MRALFLASALAMSAWATPAPAQDMSQIEAEAVRIYKMLPRRSVILQQPTVDVWSSYGTESARTIRADIPGGQARRFKVTKVGANRWDSALQFPNAVEVEKGHVVHASFWARAAKLPKGKSASTVPVSLQKNGEPYDQVAYTELQVGPEWELHTISGRAPDRYETNGMVLNLQVAGDVHTLDMGPVFLNTLGPGSVSAVSDTDAAPTPASGYVATGPVDPDTLPPAVRDDVRSLIAKVPAGAQLLTTGALQADYAYGGDSRVVDDSGVPGGQALEVRTPESGDNSWDTGVNLPITDGVDEGDVLLLAIWAKATDASNESQTAAIQPVRIQESGGDYRSAAEGVAYLSRDWKQYFIPARSPVTFAAGDSGLGYHLGLAPQTIRLGPSYLLKFPAGTDVRSLPKNRLDYKGRDADAAWRARAMDGIDRHRRADLTVRVVDSSGAPVPGVEVRVAQQKHAFNFGTFVGHRFGEPETEDERRIHEVVDESFNTLTVPTYWADWGWAGPGSKESDYRSTLAYVAERGFPYRAHTIMWPGERWMPSRILEAGTVAERRRLALEQVREVMEALRDTETPPIGIELTNEPRDNRYFQDNGDPELVEDAFRLAHSIAPDLPLFINDYGILNNGGYNTANIEFYHSWLRDMLGKGVPVGGIGFQGHFSAGLTPPERLVELLEGFAEYDLPLHITEFDIETLDEDAQADYTRDAVLAALSVPAVEAFVFWGFWEGDHWKPNAAMIREDWSRKPAYDAWRRLAFGDLWTDETVRTDRDGQARVRGMHGNYAVTVNGRTQTVSLDADGETVTVTR